jgi:hypothetical protein
MSIEIRKVYYSTKTLRTVFVYSTITMDRSGKTVIVFSEIGTKNTNNKGLVLEDFLIEFDLMKE